MELRFLIPFMVPLVYLFLLKYKKGNHPLMWVIVLYIVSGFGAIFKDYLIIDGFINFNKIKSWHLLVYSGLILVALLPIIPGYKFIPNIKGYRISKRVKYFYWLSGIGALYAFFYQLPYAIKAMSLGAVKVRGLLNVEGVSMLPESLLTTAAVAISSFYLIYAILFFIAVVNNLKWYYKLMSFIGSLLYIISSICFTARDGVVYYVLIMLFLFGLFKGNFSTKVYKKLRRYSYILLTCVVTFLFVFTFQRFASSQSSHSKLNSKEILLSGTLSYIGQQPYIFSANLNWRKNFYGLDKRFPLLAKIRGGYKEVPKNHPLDWTFGTFIKDYYDANGWKSLLGLVFAQSLFFYCVFYWINFLHPYVALIIMGFYFQFMIQGVFYFRMGTWQGNIYIVLILLFSVIVNLFYKRKIIKT